MFPAFQPLPQLNEGTNRLKTSHFPLFSLTSGSDHQQTRSFSRAIFPLASYTPRLLTDFIARARTPRESMNESNPTVFSPPPLDSHFCVCVVAPVADLLGKLRTPPPSRGAMEFPLFGVGEICDFARAYIFVHPTG